MTLTEEQRGTVGFDLEKARAALEEAIDRMSLTVSDEDGFIWEADPEQTAILQEMLDRIGRYTNNDYLDIQYQLDSADTEIERLRAENEEALESLTAAYLLGRHEKAQEVTARPKEGKIDSSEHVTEPTKMIGFDLEKARAADEALPYPLDANEIWVSGKGQMHINPPNAPSIFFTLSDLCEFRNLFHGQAAEIERLLAALVEHEEHENQTHEVLGNILGTDDTLENVAKRAAARIKDLEDALVEAKAAIKFCLDEGVEGKIGPSAAKTIDQMRISAENPQKPGPNHQKPAIWQITEERVAALDAMSSLRADVDCPECGAWLHFSDIAKHASVLRAMLTEAE